MTPEQRSDAIIRFLVNQADPLARSTGADEWASATDVLDALSTGVDRTTIFRDIQKLVSEKVLDQRGETRNRTYRLRKDSLPFLKWEMSQPPASRPKVPYDVRILLMYEPNKTYWLSKASRAKLASLSKSDRPVDDASYRRVMNSLLIDLSYASSRLEDVHISWLDTKSLVELGERPEGLSEKEYRIVMNHKNAIQFVCENRLDLRLTKRDLLDVHKLVSAGLLGNPADEGQVRRAPVFFTESSYQPLTIPQVLNEQVEAYCEKVGRIDDPFEQAFFTMAMIPYLQPFQDGNKRTSRLCMNVPLLKNSLAPFSFAQIDRRAYMFGLLSFYERGRTEFLADAFVDAYARSAPKYAELLAVVQAGGSLSTIAIDKQPEAVAHSPTRRPRP
jgi:Fic family protein